MDDQIDIVKSEVLEKLGERQLTFNTRIVELRTDVLCYYSKIPKSYKPNTHPNNIFPKWVLFLRDIEEIKVDYQQDSDTNSGYYMFVLYFEKDKLVNGKPLTPNEIKEREQKKNKKQNQNVPSSEELASKKADDKDAPEEQLKSLKSNSSSSNSKKKEKKQDRYFWAFVCKSRRQREDWVQSIEKQRDMQEVSYIADSKFKSIQLSLAQHEEEEKKALELKQQKEAELKKQQTIAQQERENRAALKRAKSLANGKLFDIAEEKEQSEHFNMGRIAELESEQKYYRADQSDSDSIKEGENKKEAESQEDLGSDGEDGGSTARALKMMDQKTQLLYGASGGQSQEDIEKNIQQRLNLMRNAKKDMLREAEEKRQNDLRRNQELERERKIKEEEDRQRQEKLNIQNGKREILNKAHEYKYQRLLQRNIGRDRSLEERIVTGVQLHILIGQFKKVAVEAVKAILQDQLLARHDPDQVGNRRYLPLSSWKEHISKRGNMQNSVSLGNFQGVQQNQSTLAQPSLMQQSLSQQQPTDEIIRLTVQKQKKSQQAARNWESFFYLEEEPFNIIVRLTWVETKQIVLDGQTLTVYDDELLKRAANEFRAMDYISDTILYQRRRRKEFCLRVPLSCVVEYCGFRAFCTAKTACDQGAGKLVYGADALNMRYVQQNKRAEVSLQALAQQLNVKAPHEHYWPHIVRTVQVPLQFDVEVIAPSEHEWEQLDQIAAELQDHSELLQYISTDLEREVQKLYLRGLHRVFPVNYGLEDQVLTSQLQREKRFRPEFLQALDFPLNPDAFESEETTPETEQDQGDVAEASKILLERSLKMLVARLDQLDVIPVDGEELKILFHENGLNMKLLGQAILIAKSEHVKQLFKQEMIARTLKKIIRQQVAERVQNFYLQRDELPTQMRTGSNQQQQLKAQSVQQEGGQVRLQRQMSREPSFIKGALIKRTTSFESVDSVFGSNMQSQIGGGAGGASSPTSVTLTPQPGSSNAEQNEQKLTARTLQRQQLAEEIQGKLDIEIQTFLLDFLNIVFGSGEETTELWEQLSRHVRVQFDYDQTIAQHEIVLGGLLTSLVQQCKLRLEYNTSLFTGQVRYPLNRLIIHPSGIERPPQYATPFVKENVRAIATAATSYALEQTDVKQYCSKVQTTQVRASEQTLRAIILRLSLLKNQGSELSCEALDAVCELSEHYLLLKNYKDAIARATTAVEQFGQIPNAQLLRAYKVLIRAHIEQRLYQRVPAFNEEAMAVLEFVAGYYHPAALELLEIMVRYHTAANAPEPALMLLQLQLQILQRCVGASTERQAAVYLQTADLQRKFNMRNEDVVQNMEKAFYIYESQRGRNSSLLASVAEQLAQINFELRRTRQTLEYSNLALQIYFETNEAAFLNNIGRLLLLKIRLAIAATENSAAILQCDRFYLLLDRHQSEQVPLYEELLCCYLQIYLSSMNQNLRLFIYQVFEQKAADLKVRLGSATLGATEPTLQKQVLVYLKDAIFAKNQRPIKFIESTFLNVAEMSMQTPVLSDTMTYASVADESTVSIVQSNDIISATKNPRSSDDSTLLSAGRRQDTIQFSSIQNNNKSYSNVLNTLRTYTNNTLPNVAGNLSLLADTVENSSQAFENLIIFLGTEFFKNHLFTL